MSTCSEVSLSFNLKVNQTPVSLTWTPQVMTCDSNVQYNKAYWRFTAILAVTLNTALS